MKHLTQDDIDLIKFFSTIVLIGTIIVIMITKGADYIEKKLNK